MLTSVLSAVGIWAAIVAGCIAWTDSSVVQRESVTYLPLPASAETRSAPVPILPERTAGLQMLALDRHARFDMVLYAGTSAGHSLSAIALNVRTGR